MEEYIGKQVLVSNTNVQYTKRLLVGILSTNDPYSYICRSSSEERTDLIGWKYCKPIIKYPRYLLTDGFAVLKQLDDNEVDIIHRNNIPLLDLAQLDLSTCQEVLFNKDKGLWHGQPIICWDNTWTHRRVISFYNAIDNRPFHYDGSLVSMSFDNMIALDSSKYENWMIKVIKEIHNDMFNK